MDEKRVSAATTLQGVSSKTSELAPLDAVQERKLLRKLDLMILPPTLIMYLCGFLDRVNIGNARLYGLEKDLGLTSTQFQITVAVLFPTYILSDLPSNLVLQKFRPSRWLSFLAVGWGVVATLSGVAQSFAGLVVCRLMLGALEGGLFPGIIIYLSLFYSKREIAFRVALFFLGAPIGCAVGGFLAYAIGHMDGAAGLRGWRWIFILEGLPSFVLGIACFWWLADDPETAYYLNDDEKQLINERMSRQLGWTKSADLFHKKDMMKAFKDWKCWAFSVALFGIDAAFWGFATFLPTIINGFGSRSATQVQALTIPCYIVATIFYIIMSWLSDRLQRRGLFIVGPGCMVIAGYSILLANVSTGAHYFACFLVAAGLFCGISLIYAWTVSNYPRYGKRTTAVGMQMTLGNAAGILASFLFPSAEGPRYIKGFAVSLSMAALGVMICLFMSWYYRMRNHRRKEGKEDHKVEGMSIQEIKELGDDDPAYMYVY